ncbi:hypothetical protein BHM03_00053592 [Ensete ventricosum]|nr:hypothetical protein BHM03_00053592 [Ensete ventricosum]
MVSEPSGLPTRGYPRLTRKGRLPAASPKGVAASRGDGVSRKGGRPLAGRLPAVTHSVVSCAGRRRRSQRVAPPLA